MGTSLKGSEHHPRGKGSNWEYEITRGLKLQMSAMGSRDVSPHLPSKI